jgi:hypothetical protein
MCLQIFLLAMGLYYSLRKRNILSLCYENYQGASIDAFNKWKALEIKSINLFLWASWGIFFASLLILYILNPINEVLGIKNKEGFTNICGIGLGILFFILLFYSAFQGSKAASFKKQNGIKKK